MDNVKHAALCGPAGQPYPQATLPPQPPSPFAQVERAALEVRELSERIEQLAFAFVGPWPENTTEVENVPPGESAVDRLCRANSLIFMNLGRIRRVLAQMEKVLP